MTIGEIQIPLAFTLNIVLEKLPFPKALGIVDFAMQKAWQQQNQK